MALGYSSGRGEQDGRKAVNMTISGGIPEETKGVRK